MTLRILFLARSLGIGGTERQLVVLARALAQRGHRVAVALLYAGGVFEDELTAAGVPIHFLGKRGRWDFVGPLRRLIALLRSEQPNIVYGYLPPANILMASAGLLVKGPKRVFGVRASNVESGRYGAIGFAAYMVEAWLARYADLIISNSMAGLKTGWRRGMPSGRGLVIPNGIDTERFQPDPHAAERKSAFRIGMVARFDPMKDHENFLIAARLIARQSPDVTFILAGPDTETLTKDVAGLPIEVRGAVAQPEKLIADLDLAVLSSRFGEGFPNAVAEAMASGVPVIATDVGDTASVIGDTGRVIPPRDPAALASAVLDLLPTARSAPYRDACRKRIEARFSVTSLAERTEAALSALSKPVVLHVITGLETGGAEGMLARLVRMPGSFRHVVASLIGEGTWGERLRAAGIEVLDLGMRRTALAPIAIWRLAYSVRRLRPAVLQTWMYHADLLGLVSGILSRRTPVVWNLRCSDMELSNYSRMTRAVVQANRHLSNFPEAIVVNSNAGRRLHESLGYHARRWAVIPNGFELDAFRPNNAARLKIRQELGLPKDSVLIGLVARFDPMKDHETFLLAARDLGRRGAEAYFVLVGRGVDGRNPVLRGQIDKNELAGRVHLLGERRDIDEVTAALDIATSSSAYGEGFSNAIGEAMACGVPCVVTDVGDSAYIVDETGLVVPRKDPAALARAWAELLAMDPEGRRQLGLAARARIVENFDLPKVVAQYESLYEDLRSEGRC